MASNSNSRLQTHQVPCVGKGKTASRYWVNFLSLDSPKKSLDLFLLVNLMTGKSAQTHRFALIFCILFHQGKSMEKNSPRSNFPINTKQWTFCQKRHAVGLARMRHVGGPARLSHSGGRSGGFGSSAQAGSTSHWLVALIKEKERTKSFYYPE